MKNKNTRGFNLIEGIMIFVVIVIIAVVVTYYIQWNRQSRVVVTNPPTNQAPAVVVDNKTEPVVNKTVDVADYARQILTDAETRFNGSYSNTFSRSNTSTTNGSGILPNSEVGVKVIADVAKSGLSIFAITNDKNSAYAVYVSLPANNGTYYCMASDGSNSNSTNKVASISDLSKKPICK